MTTAIQLSGVGKRYWQLHEQAMLLKSIVPGVRPKRSEHWAVRNLDLTVGVGETLGIMGHNGAGKTTLLRMLAGVSRPTEGRVQVAGRIAPLIGVGVGFHQEMSGRENVLVNGMLLGLTRRQVMSRFDEIVAFAELADFIDTPVKFYSSGMFLRLGFAVAVHVDPEILLVDEVLAVGDLGFQLKCFDRMRHLQSEGTTILIVSHSMHAIRLLCPRAILMRRGRLEMDGTSEEVIARHHQLLSTDAADEHGDDEESPVRVLSRELIGPGGPTHHPQSGDWLRYRAELRFNRSVDSPQVFFRITSEEGVIVYQIQTTIGRDWKTVSVGETVTADISFLARLGGGTYRITLIVSDRNAKQVLLSDPAGYLMYVAPRVGTTGYADLEARINLDGHDLSRHDDLLITPRRQVTETWR